MWDENELKKLPKGAKRYALLEGRLHMGKDPKFKMTRFISSTDDYKQAKIRMTRCLRNGTNVVLIDARMGAIVGTAWCLKEELIR